MKRAALALVAAIASSGVGGASASTLVDATAVRFSAAETGGAGRPRFITQRELAFLARIEMMGEGQGPDDALDERYVREAAERRVAVALLADLPLERPATPAELASTVKELRGGLELRVGGAAVLARAARREGIADGEVADVMSGHARAAVYLERTGTPVLRPTEEQLREVFRVANHPFRGARFETAREGFTRWYVMERLLVAEAAFFQAARGRVRMSFVDFRLPTSPSPP